MLEPLIIGRPEELWFWKEKGELGEGMIAQLLDTDIMDVRGRYIDFCKIYGSGAMLKARRLMADIAASSSSPGKWTDTEENALVTVVERWHMDPYPWGKPAEWAPLPPLARDREASHDRPID